MTTVAVLGTGRMGSAFATRFAERGLDVVVYNRSADRAATLAGEIGARHAATPAEAVRDVDVAITMLSDDAAVADIYAGPTGILAGLSQRTVAADMSTVLPSTIQALETRVRATGAGLLDAPVSGSVTSATTGSLMIMVGGEVADLDRARPAFEALATHVVHMGPLGSGATMKLAVNAVVYGLNQAISEALILAERAGVDRATAYDVFRASAIASPYVGYKRGSFVDPTDTPTAFALDLAEKDLRLILGLAREVSASMPQAGTNLESIQATSAALGPGADLAAVAEHLRTRARQPVPDGRSG